MPHSIAVMRSAGASLSLPESQINPLKAFSQISSGVERCTREKGKRTEKPVIFLLPELCVRKKTTVLQLIGSIR